MLGFLRRRREADTGPFVYLSEPTILYNTRTEKAVLQIIEEELNPERILVPSRYGLRSTFHMIGDAKALVAVAIMGKLTAGVVAEIEEAEKKGVPVYTLEIARRGEDIEYALVEGVPEELERLSMEETDRFYNEFRGEDLPKVTDIFFGKRRGKW